MKIPFNILRQYWKDKDIRFELLSNDSCCLIPLRYTLKSLYSHREIFVYTKIKTASRRREWLYGRYLLKYLVSLECYRSAQFKDIELIQLQNKKPTLYLHKKIIACDHSISHSNDIIISVLATKPGIKVGVDIEKIKILPKSMHFFLTAQEINDISKLPINSQKARIYQYWTIKEATLKALGIGLVGSMNEIQVSMSENQKINISISKKNLFISGINEMPNHIKCFSHIINDYAFSYVKIL